MLGYAERLVLQEFGPVLKASIRCQSVPREVERKRIASLSAHARVLAEGSFRASGRARLRSPRQGYEVRASMRKRTKSHGGSHGSNDPDAARKSRLEGEGGTRSTRDAKLERTWNHA